MDKFSIVIPVFNEEDNIIDLLSEIQRCLEIIKNNFEVIIVNDSSTDKTEKFVLKKFKEFDLDCKIINNPHNIGQSLSIHKGIERASYKTIVTIDGDGQNNPKDIMNLLNIYFKSDKLYLVGGIRNNRKDNLLKIISSKLANFIRKKILNDNCDDTGCSLKVFDRETFLHFPIFDGMHRFIPALFKAFNKKTFFVNVDHRPRLKGKSKYGTWGRLTKGIKDIYYVYGIIKKNKND